MVTENALINSKNYLTPGCTSNPMEDEMDELSDCQHQWHKYATVTTRGNHTPWKTDATYVCLKCRQCETKTTYL